MPRNKIFLRGSWITISRLFGGMILGLLSGILVFELIPGSNVEDPSPVHATISVIPAIAGFLIGGAAWGISISQIAGFAERKKAAIAGALGFVPITVILVVGLGLYEPYILAQLSGGRPIHRMFTIIFVNSAFLIAGISSLVVSLRVGFGRTSFKNAITIALTAAATFLIVNLMMEALGWVVGAPRAAQRATMLVVLFTCNLAASVTAGGWLGIIFNHKKIIKDSLVKQLAQ